MNRPLIFAALAFLFSFAGPTRAETTIFGISATPPGGSALTRNILDLGAKCDGVTDDTAAIQAAISSTPNGGRLQIPTGKCVVCAGLPLVVTHAIQMIGTGWTVQGTSFADYAGSILSVCAGASATTDVITLRPALNDGLKVQLSDFAILPVSGTPGRYGVVLDGANGYLVHNDLVNLHIGPLGSSAIHAEGSGIAQGTPVITNVTRSRLNGGISVTNLGDTFRIENNQITGAGFALQVTGSQAGATVLILAGNNITSTAGVYLGPGTDGAQILHNEFETLSGWTGSNGSMLDIDGGVANRAFDINVLGNTFAMLSPFTGNSVRVNYADRVHIAENRFYRALASAKDVLITANAADTNVGNNMWPIGGANRVSNSGVRTSLASMGLSYSGTASGFVVSPSVLTIDPSTATPYAMLTGNADGTVSHHGYRARPLAYGSDGYTFLYDGTSPGNLSVGVTGSVIGPTTLVTDGTWLSASQFFSKGRTFANLGVPVNGAFVYCSDCTVASPCAAGGTGAFAKRLNGTWVCN